MGYVRRPMIVTELLENGGKTIAYAAGVSHSMAVVEVEEQRMRKSPSFARSHHNTNTKTGDVAFDRTDPTTITAAGSGVRMMDHHPILVSVDTYHFWFNKPHTLKH